MERLLTKTQVAERYGVCPRTVVNFEKAGKIPRRVARWVGVEPRWREADIDAHIRQMCEEERREQVA